MEPGKSAKEQNFLTQFKLQEIANSGNAAPFKKAFEKDRARVEMQSELIGRGICVVDPNPYIDLTNVGNNVWAFRGIWGETTCANVALVFEKLELWDAGRRVILDFTVANHDPHIETMNDIIRSLRFNA
jgi:hypothetical protein